VYAGRRRPLHRGYLRAAQPQRRREGGATRAPPLGSAGAKPTLAGAPHNCAKSRLDQLVDQTRRRLAALQMAAHGGDRHLRQHKGARLDSPKPRPPESPPREGSEAPPQALSLTGDSALQPGRPIALDEVVAAVKQQQPRLVEMLAGPGWGVQRRAEPVARLN